MPSGDGQGWSNLDVPVSDLLGPFEAGASSKSWQRLQGSQYALRIVKSDALTHATSHIAIELNDLGRQQSPECGPARYGVSRVVIDGEVSAGWDLINVVPGIIEPAVRAREAATGHHTPKPTAAPSARPIGSPAPPIPMINDHYGELHPAVSSIGPAELGDCHGSTCSWSRTERDDSKPNGDGLLHRVVLLGGTSAFNDREPGNVKWNAEPHTVEVNCSLTHPYVKGAQMDELDLNAAGSSVPGVLMSAYSVYAEICHPEARNLDPDQLAKRFGYRAALTN